MIVRGEERRRGVRESMLVRITVEKGRGTESK